LPICIADRDIGAEESFIGIEEAIYILQTELLTFCCT